MKVMQGSELFNMLQNTGKKWAVGVAEFDGIPRAFIATVEGQVFAMDQAMLEPVLPLLQKALEQLKAGKVPSGGLKQ